MIVMSAIITGALMKLKINIGASSIIAVILLLNLVFRNQILFTLVAYLPAWFILQSILALIFVTLLIVLSSNIETACILNYVKQEIQDYVETVNNNRIRYTIIQCLMIILLTLNSQLVSLLLYSLATFLLYIVDGMIYSIYKEMEK